MIALGLYFLSLSALTLGQCTEARAALEESAALNSSLGDRWGLGYAYRGLGAVAQAQGEHLRAVDMFRQSLDYFNELGISQEAARVLAEMGRSVFALGNHAEAEGVWREALRIAIETHAFPVALEALVGLAYLQTKRGEMETALELLLIVLNHPASYQETRNRALQLRAKLEVQLTLQEIQLVQQRAGAKTITLIIQDILGQTG